jgi:hypothetical protein
MDETFKAQLVAEGETRVEELKARLEHENVIADYAASKIIKECWDTMETHGAAIVALNTPGLMVHKYPLKVDDRTARLGRRVAFLRRVELAERQHRSGAGPATARALPRTREDSSARTTKAETKKTLQERRRDQAYYLSWTLLPNGSYYRTRASRGRF